MGAENFFRYRGGGHPSDRFPRRGAAAPAVVPAPVLLVVGEIGVAGTVDVLYVLVGFRYGVRVSDHHGYGSSEGLSVKNAREYLDRVGFLSLGRDPALPRTPSVKLVLYVPGADLKSGRAAVDHDSQGGAVGLPPGGNSEKSSETVSRHFAPFLTSDSRFP